MGENSQIVLSKYTSKKSYIIWLAVSSKIYNKFRFFINQYLYDLKRIKINIDRLERIKNVFENGHKTTSSNLSF